MLKINRNNMRLKFKLSCVFFFMVLLLINYNTRGQEIDNSADSCQAKYTAIAKEYDAGHFSKMDSLFAHYRSTACYNVNKKNQLVIKQVLKIIIAQKRLDNYRIYEADSLQKELNAVYSQFPDSTSFKHYQFRFGPSGSMKFSKVGPIGWSAGFVLGMNFKNKTGTSSDWSVDIGAFYQRMPFSFTIVNNKSKTNGYILEGYLLITRGHSSLLEFPVRISYNIWRAEDGKFWDGIAAGAEFTQMRSTSVNSYRYEWDYQPLTSANGSHTVSFLAYGLNRVSDKHDFFTTQHYSYLIIGDNFYWRTSDRLLFIFSPEYHQNVLNQLIVNKYYTPTHSYGTRPSNYTFQISLNYLF